MFKNKHIIAAMIITPILAILGYVAADYAVSEKPHAAVAGQSYELVAKSNCRYESGQCTLENGDIRLTVVPESINTNQVTLSVTSNIPLKGARIALAKVPHNNLPVAMEQIDSSTMQWEAQLDTTVSKDTELMLVVAAGESTYYAKTGTLFMDYETGFSRANWNSN